MTHEQEILTLKAQIRMLERAIARLKEEIVVHRMQQEGLERVPNTNLTITPASLAKAENETFNEWACRYVDAYLGNGGR